MTIAVQDIRTTGFKWFDETDSVCVGAIVPWGGSFVAMFRRLSKGLTGQISITELRVYSRSGQLLFHELHETGGRPHFGDQIPARPVGSRLYLIEGGKVVGLEDRR